MKTIRIALLGATALTAAQPVTFTRHIAPILFESCAPCHRPGESAPFSLLTYDDAKKHARQIAEVTASRFMPPWPPEPGKGDFAGSRRLTDAQVAAFRQWAASGAPEGRAADLPPTPRFVEGWALGKPDLIVALDRPYTLAASGPDVFRNFVLRLPLDRRRFVRAIEIRPGNRRAVHHANVLVDRTGSARSRDGLDGAPGFEGMDVKLETEGFEPETHFLFWKPGTPVDAEPADMAWPAGPGTDLVLNMHLQPSGKPEPLQPSVGLYFTDQPPKKRPMLIQLEHDGALDIPPDTREFVVTDHLRLPVDVDVLGVYPHAHYVAKDIQAVATLPGGGLRWLIHIADWDINWQAVYRYRSPVHLPKGTVISMRYTYDNSAANPRNPSNPPRRVVAGDRSLDEMAHLWLQVLPRENPAGEDPRTVLQEALMRRRLEKYPADFLAQYTLAAITDTRGDHDDAAALFHKALEVRPGDASAHNAFGAALLASGRVEEAIPEFRAAIDLRPDYTFAHFNLGRALLSAGRYGESIPHLERAIHADASDVPALSNLGAALQAAGRSGDAVPWLRRAVQLRPAYFEARYNLGQALASSGDLDGAESELRAAAKLQPNDADTHAALGLVLARKRDLAGASTELQEALRLDPQHEEARRNLEAVRKMAAR